MTGGEFGASLGYAPDPQFSDLGAGIAFGEMPADKILRIREQAAAKFPGATGGWFTQPEVSPEVEQRLAANEEWAAGAPARSAEWEMTSRYKKPEEKAAAAMALEGITGREQVGTEAELMKQGMAFDQQLAVAEQAAASQYSPQQFIATVMSNMEFMSGRDRLLATQAINAARQGNMDEAFRYWGMLNQGGVEGAQPQGAGPAQIHPAITGIDRGP
jgi:hypothetical protein